MVKRPLLELLPALPTALPFPVVFTGAQRRKERMIPACYQNIRMWGPRNTKRNDEHKHGTWNMKQKARTWWVEVVQCFKRVAFSPHDKIQMCGKTTLLANGLVRAWKREQSDISIPDGVEVPVRSQKKQTYWNPMFPKARQCFSILGPSKDGPKRLFETQWTKLKVERKLWRSQIDNGTNAVCTCYVWQVFDIFDNSYVWLYCQSLCNASLTRRQF